MRTQRTSVLWLVAIAVALNGCAPVPSKPSELPGQPRDPGRFEESAADTAPTKKDEDEQRRRATARRLFEFESGCNVVSFFFGVFVKDSAYLCGAEQSDAPSSIPNARLL